MPKRKEEPDDDLDIDVEFKEDDYDPEDDFDEDELADFEALMLDFPELDEYLDGILDFDDSDFYTEK